MNRSSALFWGAIMGGLGVALGAFGAHALKSFLTQSGRGETFELAVRYQFYHALALLIVGLVMRHITTKTLRYSAVCFFMGIIFFSGSLYAFCFVQVRFLNFLTPIGGLFFILGWILLAAGVYKK